MRPTDTPIQGEATARLLVEIIELKWLLAGLGVRLHVERLQNDPEYARHMLDEAACSQAGSLRIAARRVREGLGLTPSQP